MARRPPSKDVNRESCTCPLSSPAAVCPMCYSGASDCSDVEYPVHSDTVTVVEQAKASGRYCLTSSAMSFEIRYLRSVLLTLNLRVVFFLMPGLIPLQYVHSDDLMFKHDSCKPRACDPAGARHYLPVRAAFDRFEETDRCAIKLSNLAQIRQALVTMSLRSLPGGGRAKHKSRLSQTSGVNRHRGWRNDLQLKNVCVLDLRPSESHSCQHGQFVPAPSAMLRDIAWQMLHQGTAASMLNFRIV